MLFRVEGGEGPIRKRRSGSLNCPCYALNRNIQWVEGQCIHLLYKVCRSCLKALRSLTSERLENWLKVRENNLRKICGPVFGRCGELA